MKLRHAFVLLCAPLSAFAAQPLMLDPGDWTDAAGIMRRATIALEAAVVHPAAGDPVPLGKFAGTVELLAVAWAGSGNDAFAKRAAEWIRVWLVDPATRMSPSLDGTTSGVVAGREVLRVVDAVRILEDSRALSADEASAVRAWFDDRYASLVRSQVGKEAAGRKDHHGTWDVVQALAFATHLGAETDLKGLCDRAAQLIEAQVAADGSQPLEFEHVDSLSNSVANLEGLMSAAVLASKAGVDLWNSVPQHGGGLKSAVEFLRPFNSAPESWPHNQREKVAPGLLDRVLAIAKQLDESLARE